MLTIVVLALLSLSRSSTLRDKQSTESRWVLNWHDYNRDPRNQNPYDKVKYFLNDVFLGHGENGILQLLKQMRTFPECGELVIYFDDGVSLTPGTLHPALPFDVDRSVTAELMDIITKKHGKLKMAPIRPIADI
jgi:hypothetical protein